MGSLFDAAKISLQVGDDEEDKKIYTDLRSSIIEAYIGVIHSVAESGDKNNLDAQSYIQNMLSYCEQLMQQAAQLSFNEEFTGSVCDLYLDIVDIYVRVEDDQST